MSAEDLTLTPPEAIGSKPDQSESGEAEMSFEHTERSRAFARLEVVIAQIRALKNNGLQNEELAKNPKAQEEIIELVDQYRHLLIACIEQEPHAAIFNAISLLESFCSPSSHFIADLIHKKAESLKVLLAYIGTTYDEQNEIRSRSIDDRNFNYYLVLLHEEARANFFGDQGIDNRVNIDNMIDLVLNPQFTKENARFMFNYLTFYKPQGDHEKQSAKKLSDYLKKMYSLN